MRWAIMLQIVHRGNPRRDPEKDLKVGHLLHSLSWISLFACMVSSMVGSGWFLDTGASFHMTGDKSLFITLEENDLQILIVMGNDEKYSVSGVSMVIFQREHGARITLTNVKYVPGLKRNLMSITMLEDRGYDVVFSKGKVFLRHIISRQVK